MQEKFWCSINRIRNESDQDRVYELLAAYLETLKTRELILWAKSLEFSYWMASRESLRKTVERLTGLTGEQEYRSFCGWLISQGKEVFRAVIRSPEVLESLIEDNRNLMEELEFGELFLLPAHVFFQRHTGGNWEYPLYIEAYHRYKLSTRIQRDLKQTRAGTCHHARYRRVFNRESKWNGGNCPVGVFPSRDMVPARA